MRRLMLLVALAALSAGACASGPEKQWYQSAGNYTVAEWNRDRAACTKSGVTDEECLKGKGWVPLSADPTKPPPPPINPKGGTRY